LRRILTPKAWKVETVRSRSLRPVIERTRLDISRAALFVKVRARIECWGMPRSSM